MILHKTILLLQHRPLFRCTWKKNNNTSWWLNLCKSVYTNGAAPHRSNSGIWHAGGGARTRLPFLGHSVQRTGIIGAFTCLKLQGTELHSSDSGHSANSLTPDQIKRTERRKAASCAAAARHRIQGDSASSLPLPFLPSSPFPSAAPFL